jgi:hypothetical protein
MSISCDEEDAMPKPDRHLTALTHQAGKLGCEIEPSHDGEGYCLWRSHAGGGRELILGRGGGVTLDEIGQKLNEIEAAMVTKKD